MPDLEVEGRAFAQDLTDLCSAVLGEKARPFTAILRPPHVWVTVLQEAGPPEASPIVFAQGGVPRIALRAEFWLSWDHATTYLRAERSHMVVTPFGKSDPIWRYDYHRDSDWKPVSYLHVHAHRDEAVHLMLAGSSQRARRRIAKDNFRTGMSDLHFPLGGDRFRPCFEDILEMLIHEFGVDCEDSALGAIRAGRESWRTKQVAASVRDHPEAAARSLRSLGYGVTPPESGPLPERRERLQRY